MVLPKQTAQCATQEVVAIFFKCVRSLLEKTGLCNAPDHIWNGDETGFCTAVASKSILTRRGAKKVHGGSGRDYITVLGIIAL